MTNFVNQYFTNVPVDGTFYKREWQRFLSLTPIDENTTTVIFVLPKLPYPFSYQIHELLASVKLNIVNQNGNIPTGDKHVTGINNLLGSLFSKLVLKINDKVIKVLIKIFCEHLYVSLFLII